MTTPRVVVTSSLNPIQFYQDPFEVQAAATAIDPRLGLAAWVFSDPAITDPFGPNPGRAILTPKGSATELLNDWLTPSENPEWEGWSFVKIDETLLDDLETAATYTIRF